MILWLVHCNEQVFNLRAFLQLVSYKYLASAKGLLANVDTSLTLVLDGNMCREGSRGCVHGIK